MMFLRPLHSHDLYRVPTSTDALPWPIIPESSTYLLHHSLHFSSLAIQFLCVSFLSYSQAHIGNLQPFSSDTPLQRVVLLGAETSAEVNVHLTASLAELTSLAGMAQGPVLGFDALTPFDNDPVVQRTQLIKTGLDPRDKPVLTYCLSYDCCYPLMYILPCALSWWVSAEFLSYFQAALEIPLSPTRHQSNPHPIS